MQPMWKTVYSYGALLAAGTLLLQWLDFRWLTRSHAGGIYLFSIALLFLVLGVVIGSGMVRRSAAGNENGNSKARIGLGISERELTVLREIAAGRSNKEIAARLEVSPNTVKTHVARLFDKLGAKRRTDAVNRARELGIVP
jgi:DNA-binding CsgD family transcriptional regulator